MSTVQRLLIVLLLIVCSSQSVLAADGTATLGEDPRPYAVILSSNTRKGIGDDWVSDQFGFAYMQNVQKGSPQTDYCYTNPRAGSSATLIAIDGVASPENPEPIVRTVGDPSDNAVKYEGRTGDCYYLVIGTYSGGEGGPGGDTSHWYSEFDTNHNVEHPHFVLTINDRYSSFDDKFLLGSVSEVQVELQNAQLISYPVNFRMSQESLLNTQGAVTFCDASGQPVNPSTVYTVTKNSQTVVYATGAVTGMVSIIATETNPGQYPVVTGTASGPVEGGDLDIDSDNNNGRGSPDRTPAEDEVEQEAPGKVVLINLDDDDDNGQPDLANGTDNVTKEDDLVACSPEFIPVLMRVFG